MVFFSLFIFSCFISLFAFFEGWLSEINSETERARIGLKLTGNFLYRMRI